MKTTEFVKFLSENYKNYSWVENNGGYITVKNCVRIEIKEQFDSYYIIIVQCKHEIKIDKMNELFCIVKELYNNIISFMGEQEDEIISNYLDTFVNG